MVQSRSTFGAISMRVKCNFVFWCSLSVRVCTPIELTVDCRAARCFSSCFWAHRVCIRAFLPVKPSAHRWRFAGSGKNETSASNCATSSIINPQYGKYTNSMTCLYNDVKMIRYSTKRRASFAFAQGTIYNNGTFDSLNYVKVIPDDEF